MTLDTAQIERLRQTAHRVREHVVRMAEHGGCFVGASLSCVDLLVGFYGGGLRIAPHLASDADRDFLLLSKGHAVPALYGTLVESGFFSADRLRSHLSTTDSIYWHPNASIPGIEFHSGSLGHLLSVGIGIALDARLRGSNSKVVVVVGDGELNEGSMWEAIMVASAHELDNLYLVVDRNELQANVPTEDLVPLEPLGMKFEAFGWNALPLNGHCFNEIQGIFTGPHDNRPTAAIAYTMRGRGLAEHEGRADRWFVKPDAVEVEHLLSELSMWTPPRCSECG